MMFVSISTHTYTLSLPDALQISYRHEHPVPSHRCPGPPSRRRRGAARLRAGPDRQAERHHGDGEKEGQDRKSTRLNSSHGSISYAVFCVKKKNIYKPQDFICNTI